MSKQTKKWVDVLKKREIEVGKVRDKIRADIEQMQDLYDSCDRAYNDIHAAINALSELA